MSNQNVNKKKILFLITKGNFGGAQRYVYDLATSLPKTKYEAVVACGPASAEASAGKGGLAYALQEQGIRVIILDKLERDMKVSNDWQVLRSFIKLFKEERPDIIHLNSSKAGGLGAFAGRISRVPRIIFTAHGWAFNESRKSIEKRVILFFHWLTVMLTHKSIAVSQKSKRDLSWLPFMNRKIGVVHNGVEAFETLTREEARKILIGEEISNKQIILSIGELHKNKAFDIAFRAIEQLPEQIRTNILYCIAGAGEEKEKLEKLVGELGIQNQVRFLGFIDNAKKLLPGGDIYLLPSRTEALPYVILEAGLVGLPIIATNVGGVSEIIQDMQNGILIHKENPNELREAIEYMLSNPEKQKIFGEKIHKTVSKNFLKTKMLRETVVLYN